MKLHFVLSAMTLLASTATQAATISLDDATPPTTAIDPALPIDGALFVNGAFIGGGDTVNNATTKFVDRAFDLNGAAGAPGVAGAVTLQGFAFASPGAWTPRAASMTLTFTYLGANGVFDGMTLVDDVVVGSTEAIVFDDAVAGNATGYEGAGRYLVNFDTDPTAMIDGLNENFRITISTTGGNARFKTLANVSGDDPISDAKFSFSGSFVAVPEPAVLATLAPGAICAMWRRSPRRA